MRKIRFVLTIVLVIMSLMASGLVYAGGYYRGTHHSGGHLHSSFGVVIGDPYWGVPLYSPYYAPYYYPYYPYQPEVIQPFEPQEYIERSDDYSQESSSVWYYCPESKTYYPYIKECPGGWEKVPAEPRSGKER